MVVLGGLALITCAIVWRLVSAERVGRRMRVLLGSSDPVERIHAIDILSERGLRSQARTLVRMTTTEKDLDVRAALLAAIARTQWEPANHPALIELRAWARLRAAQVPTDQEANASPKLEGPAARSWARENRPLRADRQSHDPALVDRIELLLGTPVLAIRLERADGTVEVDVQLQGDVHCV